MRRYRTSLTHTVILVLLWLALIPVAQARVALVQPIGAAYQVNNHTPTAQSRAAIGATQNNQAFAVWRSEDQAGDPFGIYGRALPTGPEQHLNTTTANRQDWPAIGMAWESTDSFVAWSEPTGDRPSGILGRVVAGTPMTPETRISQDLTYTKEAPAVSANRRASAYVVVWHSLGQDGFYGGIYGRRISLSGELVGDEFRVNSYTAGSELVPDVAMSYDGSFVVTWLSMTGIGHEGIYAQRYDRNFQPVGDEMEVINLGRLGDLDIYAVQPAVAIDPAGNFVITWAIGTSTEVNADVYAQRYRADGTPVGTVFRINSYTSGRQSNADVDMDTQGNFVVAWQSEDQDGSSYGVYGQLFDGLGNPVEDEFQVNEFTTGFQGEPAVAMGAVGQWTVVWTSKEQDGSSDGVFARAYQHTFAANVVNSTADPGDGHCTFDECTLREVLTAAAANPGAETITFAIPGAGPHFIQLNAPLSIIGPVTIDGYSQPGAQPNTNSVDQGLNSRLQIAINGVLATRNDVTVRGLAVRDGIEHTNGRLILEGNFIGTDVSGTNGGSGFIGVFPGSAQIGGTTPGARNLIVGRVAVGTDAGATLQGNLMGVDVTGTRALGLGLVTGQNAFITIGGDDPQARNLLTSVSLGEASADIRGNYIGVDVTGTQPLGNGGSIQSGFGAGFTAANNLIAYTGGTPIIIGNSGRVSGNRIFSNGGLGIDVGNDGVSLNDPGDLNSTGRGGKQNFPIINWARPQNGATVVEGIFDSRPSTNYTLEFFANTACDPSGFGEGERVLGITTLTTDAAGKATFRTSFSLATATGEFVTALATGPGNSSEFGPCQVMGASGVNRFLLPKGLKGAYDPTPVTNAPAGVYTLSATFTNRASRPLAQLYYRIILLTGKNLVLNAQGGPAGVGGVVKGPTPLAPGASFTIDFVIGLQQKTPFLFLPSAFGLTEDVVATEVDMTGVSYSVTAEELGVSEVKLIYLPLVVR
jgi:hypothetical protein